MTDITIKDDRTDEQKATHTIGVVARDNFMSHWGGASGGASRAMWACHPDVNPDRVFDWVKGSSEMRNVSVVDANRYRPPKGTVHLHIYVCDPDHVAAKGRTMQ